MNGPTAGLTLLLFASLCPQPGSCQEQQPSREPGVYKDAKQHRRGYFGPGREEPEPKDLNAVSIGYFGPTDPNHLEGGTIWLGANLAVEEANHQGGYKGLSFRLSPGWAENPWSGGISNVVRMAYLERVWAVIGSIDGAATHLAEQVVAKARLTLIDPASTDESVNQANVAWVFSCLPGDSMLAAVIGRALLEEARDSFALLSATDHDSRALTAEFKLFLAQNRSTPKQHIEFASGARNTAALAAQVGASGVKAVVILAGARDSARIVKDLRRSRRDLLIFGGPLMGRRTFLEIAGAAGEGVRFPVLVEASAACREFSEKFTASYDFAPDYAAMHAYDAARLLIAAIRKAGLNRVRIRDAVEELSPWQGVSGVISWNAVGRNSREASLGTICQGRVQQVAGCRAVSPGGGLHRQSRHNQDEDQ